MPHCEELFVTLDDQTAECDALQTQLEQAACTRGNVVIEVRNLFAESWAYAIYTYQRVNDEVHCLEIDRWKEWRLERMGRDVPKQDAAFKHGEP